MSSIILTPTEIASLLLLNVAVRDVLDGKTTPDIMEELNALQGDLERILYKEKSPLA